MAWVERWVVYNNSDAFNPAIVAPVMTKETEQDAKTWVAAVFAAEEGWFQPNPVIQPLQVWIEDE